VLAIEPLRDLRLQGLVHNWVVYTLLALVAAAGAVALLAPGRLPRMGPTVALVAGSVVAG
jgi:hypothetical protein